MNLTRLGFVLLLLVSAGCASVPMEVIPDQQVQQPSANQSQIVFMRSSFVQDLIQASLFEVRGDKIEFIGILQDDTKIALKTTPGEHLYMVVSTAADFLQADLAPGKTHYVIVKPRIGSWKPRFAMYPISANPSARYTNTSEDFDEWRKETTLVDLSEAALSWYQQNKAEVEEKRIKYWPEWLEMAAPDKFEHMLLPADGL